MTGPSQTATTPFILLFFCLYPTAYIVVQLRGLTLSEAREACTSFSCSPGLFLDLSGESSMRSQRSFAWPCPQTKFAAVSSGFGCLLFFFFVRFHLCVLTHTVV